jgi:hypothetical protein
MIAAKQTEYLTATEKGLLRSVLYFDIFNYPITSQEAFAFAPFSEVTESEQVLDQLVEDKILFKHGNFYSCKNDFQLAIRRSKGNELAQSRMKTAQRYSRLIASFPFVRAVLLSGSISKNYMDENSDIDYFIITESKRVWIVRAALVAFRKMFLFNSIKNFCTNYLIDVKNLLIPDQNIFTATEMCTLKSMYGHETICKFQNANGWVFDYLPNGKFQNANLIDRPSYLKTLLERIFSFRSMDKINQRLMEKSIRYWRKKYSLLVPIADFGNAIRAKEGTSKIHPKFYQRVALEELERKIRKFEIEHGIDLSI